MHVANITILTCLFLHLTTVTVTINCVNWSFKHPTIIISYFCVFIEYTTILIQTACLGTWPLFSYLTIPSDSWIIHLHNLWQAYFCCHQLSFSLEDSLTSLGWRECPLIQLTSREEIWVYLLGTTFDFDGLWLARPPECLFAGWGRTRFVLPFELHLSDFRACYSRAEEVHAGPFAAHGSTLRNRWHCYGSVHFLFLCIIYRYLYILGCRSILCI